MIPVIDLNNSYALQHIEDAYTTVGFAVFINAFDTKQQHVFDLWFDQMKAFFELDIDTKNSYGYIGDTNLGYTGWGGENVDPTAPKDMKESFNYNDTRMPEHMWPVEVPGFRETARTTVVLADDLTLRIMGMFDQILGTGSTLTDAHLTNYSTTRVIKYPAYDGPIEDRQMRIGEHSDYGTLTLLWQINDIPGLEVQDLNGKWHPVPYVKNGVVCNIGDLMQRWTNDYFKSTKHRVVNSHIDQVRYSMPHFVDPAPGTIIKNLTPEPAKYEPVESLSYLKWRLAQSY